MYSKGLFWFRRDLRLDDNAALYEAAKNSQELNFVFVFDKNILNKLQDKDDRRLTFIWNSLVELKDELKQLGAYLYLLYGDPIEVIPQLAQELGVNSVFTNRDYETYALHRDEMVSANLSQKDIHFATSKDQIVFELQEVLKPDKKPYTVFTPYKKAWLKQLIMRPEFYLRAYPSKEYLGKKTFPACLSSIKQIQSLNQIGFTEAQNLIVQSGFQAAQKQFANFIDKVLLSYSQMRNFLKPAMTSELSVHLRFGTIGIRQCSRTAWQLMLQALNPQKENIESWLSELIWREFYSMILQAFPFVENESFKAEYRNLPWRKDTNLLNVWQEGQTGYPIVDAAMRQLKTTGQMYNRVRMIVASFLCKDLLIDWRLGEAHFARYLLDYDLASNNGGWQWAASTGTDASPYFRVFNPCLQSQKFDPEAEYIKKFIPELACIKPKDIHSLNFELSNYPPPIVNHHEAKNLAINFFKPVSE